MERAIRRREGRRSLASTRRHGPPRTPHRGRCGGAGLAAAAAHLRQPLAGSGRGPPPAGSGHSITAPGTSPVSALRPVPSSRFPAVAQAHGRRGRILCLLSEGPPDPRPRPAAEVGRDMPILDGATSTCPQRAGCALARRLPARRRVRRPGPGHRRAGRFAQLRNERSRCSRSGGP